MDSDSLARLIGYTVAAAFIHDNVGSWNINISAQRLLTTKSGQGGIHIAFQNIFEVRRLGIALM
jgi:hypothetical protein